MIFFFILIFLSFSLNAEDPSLIPLKGEIQSLHGSGQVSLNIGSDQGVKLGTVFNAYNKDRVLRFPLTNEILIEEGKVVGRLRVIHVAPRFCRCEFVEPFEPFLGQLVLGRPLPEVGNQPPRITRVTWDATTLRWGHPVLIHVEGFDPENKHLHLKGSTDSGEILSHTQTSLMLYPPKDKPHSKINLELSDNIGKSLKTLYLTYDQTQSPTFIEKPNHVYDSIFFPFKAIDQFEINQDGYIWALDKRNKNLSLIGPNFNIIRTIGLKGAKPSRFSLNSDRIAILDERNERILIYRHDGTPLARVGQQGSDVHLWQQAGDVLLLNDNRLAVLDIERQTVVVHDANHNFLSCVGYPNNQPPGFLSAKWLERQGDGLAVLDMGQNSRVIFDKNLKYINHSPLGDITLPISGSDGPRPNIWPEQLDKDSLTGISRSPQQYWIAMDKKGKRFWKWSPKTPSGHYFDWSKPQRSQRLFRGLQGQVYWLQGNDTFLSVDLSGWRRPISLPKQIKSLTSFRKDEPPLWLDGEHKRIFHDPHYFGQKGSKQGMMDDPQDVLTWKKHIAVLDAGREAVLVFSQEGLLIKESYFKDCQAFCLNTKDSLVVLGEEGTGWEWTDPKETPRDIKIPEAKGIRVIQNGYLLIKNRSISVTDTQFNVVQEIDCYERVEDAVQSSLGELWVATTKGLLRFQAK